MPFFRYFADKTDNAPQSAVHRVIAAYARPWVLAHDNGSEAAAEEGKTWEQIRFDLEAAGRGFRWAEVEFKTWWENAVAPDSKAAWVDGAASGEFWAEVVDPGTGSVVTIACSLESGEPVEKDAEEGRVVQDGTIVEEGAPVPVEAPAEPAAAPEAAPVVEEPVPAAEAPDKE